MFKPLVVIPFYNHFECFNKVVRQLKILTCPVVLVNDGSSMDESKKIKRLCSKYGFDYIELIKNSGKGVAVMQGMKYAASKGYSHILQIDADGQHQYQDIEKFLVLSKKNPSCIINGAPLYDKSIPKARLYGRKITKFWVWLETAGADIIDTMCGFRVYPLKKIKNILPIIYFKRMGFDTEILVKSYLNNVDVINLQTKVVYPKDGISHFNCLKDNLEISAMHTQLCCYALYKLIFRWRKNV